MEPFLPEHMKEPMNLYLEHGIKPGSFLTSVLCNDLAGAVGRADHINITALPNIVSYCYNYLPSEAWGSEKKVERWIQNRTNSTQE